MVPAETPPDRVEWADRPMLGPRRRAPPPPPRSVCSGTVDRGDGSAPRRPRRRRTRTVFRRAHPIRPAGSGVIGCRRCC